MTRKLIISFMCVLIVFISACSNSTDKVEYVADVTLEIRSGTLYVTPYKGPTYRTFIKADDITVLRPDIGSGQGGSMCSATVLKDNKTVATFDRSYVSDIKVTRAQLEEHFGPVVRVLSPFELTVVILLFLVLCTIAVYKMRAAIFGRKGSNKNTDLNPEH